MELGRLLAEPDLSLRLLVGGQHLDRPVTAVCTTDLRDPRRYLSGGELVLTGLVWRRSAADSAEFVAALAAGSVAGLAAGEAEFGTVPDDLLRACERYGVPLLAVPVNVSFARVTTRVNQYLSGERRTTGPYRSLVSAVADGDGLPAVFELLEREYSLTAWALTAAGRLLVGPGRQPPATAVAELVAGYLRDGRCTVTAAATEFEVLPIGRDQGSRALGWFLAVAGELDGDRQRLATDLADLVALERARLTAGQQVERRLADELVALAGAGSTGVAELDSRLRVCGLEPSRPLRCVVAELSGAPGLGGGPGETARQLLEELLRPLAAGAVVAVHHGQAVALLPTGRDRHPVDGPALARLLRSTGRRLGPALAGGELAVGVSASTGGESVRDAMAVAGHALELARGGGPVSVVASEEVTSHVLLLAAVPEQARRDFTERLLGPLVRYDRVHGGGLVPTVTAFLAQDGSWARTAEQLHLHVNTVRYRISRVEELTGRDLARLPDRVDFLLALQMARSWPPRPTRPTSPSPHSRHGDSDISRTSP